MWSYVGTFGTQLMSIVPAMILARLLDPSQYGIIAMSAVFIGIAYQLADGGFGNALVQKDKADDLDYNTVFYFNIGICGFIYAILFFCAPLIARFFNEPVLTAIVRVSSLGIIFLAFGQIQSIIFKKNIEYKKPVTRGLICQFVSIAVALVLAYTGWGVWALVYQGLTYTLMSSVLNWFISPWRPKLQFSMQRLRGLFRFGSKTLASSIIDYGFNRGYDIVIGKFYSPAALGLYNRADSTCSLFKSTFFGVFSRVTFPVFVKMQNDDERLRMNIRKFVIISSMIIFVVMATLMVMGHPLFTFLYGTKWYGSIPFFHIACIIGMLYPIVSILESVILAKGYSGTFLMISIIRKIFVVVVLFVAWRFGIMWMMVGQACVSVIEIALYTRYTNRLVKYSFANLVTDLAPYFGVTILIALAVWGADIVAVFALSFTGLDISVAALTRLLVSAVVATVMSFGIYRALKMKGYRELIEFLRDAMGDKKILRKLDVKA